MADRRERTAQEREAARREREFRRADADDEVDLERGLHDAPADDEPWPDERPSGIRRVSRAGPQIPGRSGRRPPPSRPPARRARSGARPRRSRRRSHSWVGRIVALAVLIVVAAVLWLAAEVFQPFGTSPHGRVTVAVPAHAGARQIGDLLARKGVISSGMFFALRAAMEGDRSKLRSGTYHLQQGMGYDAVLTKLTTPPRAVPTTEVTVTPGHTRAQVAALLHRAGIKGNYVAATRRSRLLDPRSYGAPRHVPSLEGFLFPDTFRLVKPVKVSALVADQLRDFKRHFHRVDLSYARSRHLSAYKVLTIASLIEGEAAKAHDRRLIASVIYNRLADGMMLQLDATTRYATGNATGPLTDSQLHSPSPYNTRTHTGLPPTPINSPSLASIQAAAHPAKTHYLYFFTKPCHVNTAVFASSYPQFQHLLAVDKRTHC